MSSKLNIRTGDTVMVITGDEMKDRCRPGQENDRPPSEAPSAGRNRRKA